MLANMAVDAELFHTPSGTAFADLMIDARFKREWTVVALRHR
jgi:hypothetical protein